MCTHGTETAHATKLEREIRTRELAAPANRTRNANRRSLEHRIAEGATAAPTDCSVQNELPTRLSGGTLVRRNTPSKHARIVPTLAGTPITENYPGMPV
jgi:hypothetical protein